MPFPPPGTLAWIERLKWSGLPDFMTASRDPLYPPSGMATNDTGAFLQTHENFSVFWIMKAGHMVGETFQVTCRISVLPHINNNVITANLHLRTFRFQLTRTLWRKCI